MVEIINNIRNIDQSMERSNSGSLYDFIREKTDDYKIRSQSVIRSSQFTSKDTLLGSKGSNATLNHPKLPNIYMKNYYDLEQLDTVHEVNNNNHRGSNHLLPGYMQDNSKLTQRAIDATERLNGKEIGELKEIKKKRAHLKKESIAIQEARQKIRNFLQKEVVVSDNEKLYNSIELFFLTKIKDNETTLKNYLIKNADKMSDYDHKIKKLTRISEKSLYLYFVRYFHPDCCQFLLKFLRFDSNRKYTRDEFVDIVKNPQIWKGKRIFETCFYCYNANQVGNIDQNDLVTLNSSIYASKHFEQYMNDDITKMARYIQQKKLTLQSNGTTGILNKNYIFNTLSKNYETIKNNPNMSNKNEYIENTIKRIQNSNLKADVEVDQISYDDFLWMEWKLLPHQECGVPRIFINFFQILTGIEVYVKPKKFTILKYDRKNILNLDLKECWNDFTTTCKDLDIDYTEIEEDLPKVMEYVDDENYKKYFDMFRLFSDDKFRITLQSLTDMFEDILTNHGLVKFCEQVYNCISHGYPITFFKFIHFFYQFHNSEVRFLYELMDLNNDGTIGTYEIEFFRDIFQYYHYLMLDLTSVENHLKLFNQVEVKNYFQFATALGFKSVIQNYLYLIFAGDEDHRHYGTADKRIDIKTKVENIWNFYDIL